jgi:hypothetical protein
MTAHINRKLVAEIVYNCGMDAAIERFGSRRKPATLRRIARAGKYGVQQANPSRCRNSPEREAELLELVKIHGVTDASRISGVSYAYLNTMIRDRGLDDYRRGERRRGPKVEFTEEDLEQITSLVGDYGIARTADILGITQHRVRKAVKAWCVKPIPRSMPVDPWPRRILARMTS